MGHPRAAYSPANPYCAPFFGVGGGEASKKARKTKREGAEEKAA